MTAPSPSPTRRHSRAVLRTGVRTSHVRNREGHSDYDVHWRWHESATAGLTAVLRVKDEAASLPFVLPPLLAAVAEVLVVDNGSTDGTAALARQLAVAAGAEGRMRMLEYPFTVARCGSEHLATPPDSVHSLSHFYNWCFSHVQTKYALKWDGDMVLTEPGLRTLSDLAWQLEGVDAIVSFPRCPVYVASRELAFLDLRLARSEMWAWPNSPGHEFFKAFNWEHLLRSAGDRQLALPNTVCFELKWLEAEEFAHWSDNQFSPALKRKGREWQVFQALRNGHIPAGVVQVDADPGEHVVETVRRRYVRVVGQAE